MKLGVDYDDAITVWLNGTKIYESPTSPMITSTDYWDKVATDNHSASGEESINPDYQTIDVSAHMGILNNGSNLLVIGNWNRMPGSSDLVAGVILYCHALESSICNCALVPDATVFSRGSTLGFQASVTNNTGGMGTVLFGTKITKPDASQTGFIWGPIQVYLNPHQTKSGHKTHTIPVGFELGTYTYHGFVGRFGNIYDECRFDFQVVAP
jgi:hypothetical protein